MANSGAGSVGQQDKIIDQLVAWGERRADVAALILTSTRAIPGGHTDAYSDYDVIAVVEGVEAMVSDTGWLAEFGEVLIDYWDPVESDAATGAVQVGNITNYVDGLKIDFSLWNARYFTELTSGPRADPELDAGHRVLLDKSGLTAGLPAPTYRSYIPRRPDEAGYQRLITDFLIGVPYVAKGLLRDELLPTKWVLDFDMRFNYLVPMIEWRVQCDHDWSLKSGNLGKGLKQHLPPSIWQAMENTFTGADPEANWTALFAMIDLFATIAREVAEHLGYRYPGDLIANVTEHARRMRAGDFG
ncbi:aminoglycoside 6-adenylyltransferase [Microlunatus soli]|uniref:Aminoglycoside 6-adenylyltransferase n=1 Tax=Microlunatus soli TaxID=630515 RepID=A0A1H1ZDK0_9ACTN|nr:aminoglycoside 6-adenylyltransferase [Microlunatus soli]SDT31286.1 aminoglycoside 6-adenylyltransferase [Microlunatus soli]